MSPEVFDDFLLEFTKAAIVADNYRDLAARILKLSAEITRADLATLWRAVDEDNRRRLILAASWGVEFLPTEEEIRYDILPENTPNSKIVGLTAWIAIKKQPIIVNTPADLKDKKHPWAGSHSGKWDDKQFWRGKEFGCLIGYPIILDGMLLGVIKFERYSESPAYEENEVRQVEMLSNPIALALKGVTTREEQERKRQNALRDLCSKLLVPASISYYQDIVNLTAQILTADISTLWLFNEKERILELAAQYGLNPNTVESSPQYNIPSDRNVPDSKIEGLTAWTFLRQRPFYAQNWDQLKEHPSHQGYWDKAQWDARPEEKFGCLFALPLVSEDKTIGVIKVERRNSPTFQPFTEVERATFDLIAVIASVAPLFKAVIRDKESLVQDYFHILRAPTSNAISALNNLRDELNRKKGPRSDRVNSRLTMMANNLAVAYTQTLNAFEIATKPERPVVPKWHNLLSVIQPSKRTFAQLYPSMKIREGKNLASYEIRLTDYQVTQMHVVLHNLIDNAITFSGDEPVRIEVLESDRPKKLKLSVIDNGIGIETSKIDNIWQQGVSYRPDSYEKPESRGQGLAIVSRIIEELGWERSIESTVGKGTTISMHISKQHWRKAK
jgi:signal transduction histidine kinase